MSVLRFAIVAFVLSLPLAALADVAVPPLTGRVVDLTNTLGSDDVAALDQKLKDFEGSKGSQVAVLIVPTTAPETIEQYSLRVVEQWKLGRKKIDDGALLIIAKDDRKLRIEVGYGLEGALNDATSKRIIDEVITPRFRNGDFAGGIGAGVDRILSVINGEPLPAPAPQRKPRADIDDLGNLFPFLLIGTLFAGGILRVIFGRLLGAIIAGGGIGAVIWFLLGVWPVAIIAALVAFFFTLVGDSLGSGGGGYIPGGSGGGFSSGSSGGGFSGGGGSFGGGGASGSW